VEAEERHGVRWPLAIVWRGRRSGIGKVLSHWEEHCWRDLPPPQRCWYKRGHRAYSIAVIGDGEVLEIYVPRNLLRKPWVTTRRVRQAGEDLREPCLVSDGSR